MKLMNAGDDARIFWGEIAPCDHLVQIYEDDDVFLDSLEGFVGGGLRSGDGIVIIASAAHRKALDARLEAQGFDLARARADDSYIALDASETLATFMVNAWPDEALFNQTVSNLLTRAGHTGRRVRAFGEMVAILWAGGHCAATVRLEYLWNRFCEQAGFSLLCAYPKSGFTGDAAESIRQICDAHTHVLQGSKIIPRGENSADELRRRVHPLN